VFNQRSIISQCQFNSMLFGMVIWPHPSIEVSSVSAQELDAEVISCGEF
jgi:hypothetical protein